MTRDAWVRTCCASRAPHDHADDCPNRPQRKEAPVIIGLAATEKRAANTMRERCAQALTDYAERHCRGGRNSAGERDAVLRARDEMLAATEEPE